MSYAARFRFALICLLMVFSAQKGFSDDWERVYLATFPRSGNHWMRYLIEEATHTATSSVYPDQDTTPAHMNTLFAWGGYCVDHGYNGDCRYPEPGEIVLIKTHFPHHINKNAVHLPYTKVIRIVRHPIDSFYSLYMYNHRNNPPQPSIPRKSLLSFIETWNRFEEYWDRQPNVFTIRYEDLYEHPHEVFAQVMQEIGYVVTQEDIERAVAKYPPTGGILKHIKKFSEEDLMIIANKLGPKFEQYNYTIPPTN